MRGTPPLGATSMTVRPRRLRKAHEGEAESVRASFLGLTDSERKELMAFLADL